MTSGSDSGTIRIWNVESGQCIKLLEGLISFNNKCNNKRYSLTIFNKQQYKLIFRNLIRHINKYRDKY